MKKQFQVGVTLESNTEYFATEKEYHVYFDDTTVVADDRYVALRKGVEKEFNVFVLVKDKKNITLDFCGATLVMHGAIQPFLLDGSENVTVKNCKVTYARPPYTEAEIIEVAPDYARLRLNKHCPCYIEDGRLVPYGDGWENHNLNYRGMFYQVFDKETRKGCGLDLGVMGNSLVLDPKWPYHPIQYTVEADGEDVIMKGKIPQYFAPNRVLCFAHEKRALSSVFMVDCKDVKLENYRILSGWGMGILSYRTENITLDRLMLTHDENSPCIVTNAADAVHTFGTSGRFVIRDSVIEGMIDDAVNVHSNFRTVISAKENVICTHVASCEKEANILYHVGDEIAVYRGKSLEEVARYTITAIEDLDESSKKFVVDRPAKEHAEGDLIENLTTNCDLIMENCVFGKGNTHLRLQTRGKVVMKNCENELTILLSGDASYWFESSPITDLTIENCKFIGKNARIKLRSEVFPTEAAPYYHRNLKIINNTLETDVPINGGYADGIVFKGNVNTKGVPMTLELTNCGSVDADGCTVERKTEVKTELKLN